MNLLDCNVNYGFVTDWVAIAVSVLALIVSIVSIALQYFKQKWLRVEIAKYRTNSENNYARFELRLINTKNRKHSISLVSVKIDDKDRYATTDEAKTVSYRNDYFQEGETKFVELYLPLFNEEKFCIKFLTDSGTTKLKPKAIRKYREENSLSSKVKPNEKKTKS